LKGSILIGHSVGAIVALKVALDYPDLVGKLFLVDWGAIHPASLNLTAEERLRVAIEQRAERQRMTDEAFQAQLTQIASTALANHERLPVYLDMFRQTDRLIAAQGTYEGRIYDLRGRLPELKLPVGAVFGIPKDAPKESIRQQARAVIPGIRNLQLAFFEETSHWLIEERPQEFDRVIAEFIAGRKLMDVLVK
jgi:pimeloyl-ACP methyl ester carboxylesterase